MHLDERVSDNNLFGMAFWCEASPMIDENTFTRDHIMNEVVVNLGISDYYINNCYHFPPVISDWRRCIERYSNPRHTGFDEVKCTNSTLALRSADMIGPNDDLERCDQLGIALHTRSHTPVESDDD